MGSSKPAGNAVRRTMWLLVGTVVVAGAGVVMNSPDLQQRVRYEFESWVLGLQARFGIVPGRTPSANNVELIKPPMALHPGSAPVGVGSAPVPVDLGRPRQEPVPLSGTPPLTTIEAHAARGTVGEAIALDLNLHSGLDADSERVIIGGLPMDASLSSGARDELGRWQLDASALAGLTLHASRPGQFTLFVRTQPLRPLRFPRATAETPVEVTVLAPATASDTPPAPPPVPSIDELLERGRKALELGDGGAARLFFEAAAERDNATAMLLLARSYDPSRGTEQIGVSADVIQAVQWYQRAAAAGLAEAGAALDSLRQWLQQQPNPDEAQRKALEALTPAKS